MDMPRLDALKKMVAERPDDSFLRYGLAMEYRNGGNLEEALSEFRALIANDPDYSAAYYHAGQTLERLGRTAEACEAYRQGIAVTQRKGDQKTRNELQAALDLIDF